MKVLVFSAHPDDLEIGCAGTLLKYAEQGYTITSIVTVKPSKEVNQKRSKQIVEQELVNSYKISQFKYKIFETDLHANGRPNLTVTNNTISKLSQYNEPADIVILPNPQDYHQDHRHTYEIALPLVVKTAKEIWLMHSWPYCNRYNPLGNLTVDISAQWQTKEKLLECYNSYLDKQQIKKIKILNQYIGSTIDAEFAESFTVIKRNE